MKQNKYSNIGAATAGARGTPNPQAYQMSQLQQAQLQQMRPGQQYVDLNEGMHMDDEYGDVNEYYDEEIEGSGDSGQQSPGQQ